MKDKARKQTDKKLLALEKRIAKIYKEASEEVKETAEKYFDSFKEQDEKQKEKLEDGEITEQQYKQWRLSKMVRGNRFKTLQKQLSERMTKANELAAAYMAGDMASIYSINWNYTTNDIKTQGGNIISGIDFTLYDEATVKNLIENEPDLLPTPKVDRKEDLSWNRKQVTKSITSAILQGKSIPEIAKDIQKRIPEMNMAAAIRNARTAITAAENAGRQQAAEDLEKKGVILEKEWMATSDSRTRDSHRRADGQRVPNDEPFIVGGEKLMYPGDKKHGASGENIYNCRCSSRRVVVGFKSTLAEEQRKKIKRVK